MLSVTLETAQAYVRHCALAGVAVAIQVTAPTPTGAYLVASKDAQSCHGTCRQIGEDVDGEVLHVFSVGSLKLPTG